MTTRAPASGAFFGRTVQKRYQTLVRDARRVVAVRGGALQWTPQGRWAGGGGVGAWSIALGFFCLFTFILLGFPFVDRDRPLLLLTPPPPPPPPPHPQIPVIRLCLPRLVMRFLLSFYLDFAGLSLRRSRSPYL